MIYLTKEQILNLKPIKNGLSGKFGSVRNYDDNMLIKVIYDTQKAKQHYQMIKSRVNDLLGTKVDDVSFPLDVTQDDNECFFAYTMPIINGTSYNLLLKQIKSGKNDLTLNDLSKNYHKAKEKVLEVAENNVMIWDLKPDNCCITNNLGMGIYDVDFFKKISDDYARVAINNEWFLNYTFETFLKDVMDDLKIPRKHFITDVVKTVISANYVDDLLEEIVKNTSRDTKTLGELLRR